MRYRGKLAAICAGAAVVLIAVGAAHNQTSQASADTSDHVQTPFGNVILDEKGYTAKIAVVSQDGVDEITVRNSYTTIGEALKNRGYNISDLREENNNPLKPEKTMKNGSETILYSKQVNGKTESIKLEVPSNEVKDPTIYVGQKVEKHKSVPGTALRTVITEVTGDSKTTGSSISETYLTILTAPKPGEVRIGTKPCKSEFLCDLIKEKREKLIVVGDYVHPLGHSMPWGTYHGAKSHEAGAVDIPAAAGTPIYAVADGEIEFNSWDGGGGGNVIAVKHADGSITGYAHMIEKGLEKVGTKVKAGQVIGFVGSTGNSSGPHLHLDVFKSEMWGQALPAYSYMKINGVDLGPCSGDSPCELADK